MQTLILFEGKGVVERLVVPAGCNHVVFDIIVNALMNFFTWVEIFRPAPCRKRGSGQDETALVAVLLLNLYHLKIRRTAIYIMLTAKSYK
jgi:hypothetical protein